MRSKIGMLDTTDPSTWTFGQLLDWHLTRGTHPDGTPDAKGIPWPNKDFANSVAEASKDTPKSERTIRNWRNGDTKPSPADLSAILGALFGGKAIYADWRAELMEKYHRNEGENEPQSTAIATVSSLPTKPLRCLGRDDDLKSVIEALVAERDNSAVLVLGGPGMGKTTLTRQAAVDSKVIQRFGQRRWFVELETAANAEALEKAIIVALGLDPASTRFDAALALLGQGSGLLVLDNLETPWDGEREKVEALLGTLHHVPGLAILASIRGNDSPAGVRWTRRRTMHPLESPHDQEMFLEVAGGIKADDRHLPPLLTLLAGVPIAIELVAQLAAAHDSLSAIHDEWLDVGIALAKRRGVEPSRLSSLEVSLELSFLSDRIGEHGRRLFGILGQLPTGIAPGDLKALLGQAAFEARQGLLSTALAFERAGRLDLLPPVRDHARRLHQPTDEDMRLWRKYYLALASDHGDRIGEGGGAAAVQRLMPELPNLETALRASLTTNQLGEAVSAVAGIALLLSFTGLSSGATIRDLAAACHAHQNAYGEAECMKSLGDISVTRSEHDLARKAYEQALPLYRQLGETLGEANCIKRLGDIAYERSDPETARRAYEQALPLYQKVGSVHGEANCICQLGTIALARSDYDAARQAYEQALALYRQIENLLGETNCVGGLGEVALARADYDSARKAYEQLLPLYRQAGNILGEANCIARLGDIALVHANYDDARKAYKQARPLFSQIGNIVGEANCIQGLGDVALARLDPSTARRAYEQALDLYQQVNHILGEANCVRGLGDIALARSDRKAARKAYDEALVLYRRIEEPYSIGNTHLALANVTEGTDRNAHRAAAREAWLSIGRKDLVKKNALSE